MSGEGAPAAPTFGGSHGTGIDVPDMRAILAAPASDRSGDGAAPALLQRVPVRLSRAGSDRPGIARERRAQTAVSITAFPDHTEAILRALPLGAGEGIAALAARFGLDGETLLRVLEALVGEGLIEVGEGELRLTEAGAELLAE